MGTILWTCASKYTLRAPCMQDGEGITLLDFWDKHGSCFNINPYNGPLARYVKLRVAHAPGMPERFPRRRLKRKPHARVVMYVEIAYPRWQGKRSRHSRRMRIRNCTYLVRGPW